MFLWKLTPTGGEKWFLLTHDRITNVHPLISALPSRDFADKGSRMANGDGGPPLGSPSLLLAWNAAWE